MMAIDAIIAVFAIIAIIAITAITAIFPQNHFSHYFAKHNYFNSCVLIQQTQNAGAGIEHTNCRSAVGTQPAEPPRDADPWLQGKTTYSTSPVHTVTRAGQLIVPLEQITA